MKMRRRRMKRVAVRPLSSGLVLVFLLQLQCCAVESTMTVSEMRKRKEDAKAAERTAAASITCDLCPIILKHVWSKMGATSKARDARSHHFIMSVLEDVCEEGETDGEPEFFQGYELASAAQDNSEKASAKPFFVRPKSASDGASLNQHDDDDEVVTDSLKSNMKIVRRSCIDIADHFDQDFGVVVHNNRFKSWGGVKEQICYWLLKCDPMIEAQRELSMKNAGSQVRTLLDWYRHRSCFKTKCCNLCAVPWQMIGVARETACS
eukprot:INCI3143.3.p1 GENE.INCI3143.3~~INCI3143.3.p1  ORF type:complete len:264 (+),score=39.13 INCI3143.3:166-957(+)